MIPSAAALLGYLSELVHRKRREPGDDLLSRLVIDHVANGALNHETATMNGLIMLSAGHETTASMIALGTLTLLEHPDAWERLRHTDDPAVIANIVEELMRYLTIVPSLVDRVALEDLTIGGQLIRAGEILFMNLPAGNWDLGFVDNPDSFDINRNARGHVGFGYGVHQCLARRSADRVCNACPQIARIAFGGSSAGAEIPAPEGDLRRS
jgi:cytochrome P450